MNDAHQSEPKEADEERERGGGADDKRGFVGVGSLHAWAD